MKNKKNSMKKNTVLIQKLNAFLGKSHNFLFLLMTSFKKLMQKMKEIQNTLLEFLEDETESEEKYETFVNLVEMQKIKEDKEEFKALLRLINIIGNDHHRCVNFNKKIDLILEHFRNDIQKHFSNSKIFDIFRNNKRILLFLIESKLITIDEYIASRITSDTYIYSEYCSYFLPEIKMFLTEEFIAKYKNNNLILKNKDFIEGINNKLPEDFYEKRRTGERETYLSELIRNDDVVEFVIYVNKMCLTPQSFIEKSIFETNPLLMFNENITLIEYAAFFGSIGIIKNLRSKGADLPQRIWEFAIHSENAELIQYLEDNKVRLSEDYFEEILFESIKCHHNSISNYIIFNLITEKHLKYNNENVYVRNLYRCSFEYHNYCFFPKNIKYKFMLFYLCEFDYYSLVKLFLLQKNIDINATIIFKKLVYLMMFEFQR